MCDTRREVLERRRLGVEVFVTRFFPEKEKASIDDCIGKSSTMICKREAQSRSGQDVKCSVFRKALEVPVLERQADPQQ